MKLLEEGLSDEEDNSWADELSHSEEGGAANYDDYYGEEEDYGEEETASKTKKSAYESAEKVEIQEEESFVKKKPNKKICINVFCTEYDVIKKVAKKVNEFKMKEIEEDHEGGVHKGVGGGKLSTVWDISWHDLAISPDFMSKMEPYQKVNHFPGMYVVC